jgi:hypothetical protein
VRGPIGNPNGNVRNLASTFKKLHPSLVTVFQFNRGRSGIRVGTDRLSEDLETERSITYDIRIAEYKRNN